MTDPAEATQTFYGRWASVYDHVARLPGVRSWRASAAAALDLDSGATVVDLGCGTGANVPHLLDHVGDSGKVVGVDLTRGMLVEARRSRRGGGDVPVTFCQGDATRPLIDGPVDAVLASFLVGMLDDPATAVEGWVELLRPGGTIVLLEAAPTEWTPARPLNLPFGAFVWASAPDKRRGIGRPSQVLASRVREAHRALERATEDIETTTFGAGFVRLAAGTKAESK